MESKCSSSVSLSLYKFLAQAQVHLGLSSMQIDCTQQRFGPIFDYYITDGSDVAISSAKSLHLRSLRGADERLRLFKADMLEDGSFDEAVDGCDGVFHVAMPMLFSVSNSDEDYVRSNIIDPAIRGTLNLLRACLKAKSVRRVVLTSSVSTITAKDGGGKWRDVVDENCQTPIDHIWATKASGWVRKRIYFSKNIS